MNTFETLQVEVGTWSERNFGDQSIVNPVLGVTEEFGELIEHIECHGSGTEHELDCVGDMLVYLADFCHRRISTTSELPMNKVRTTSSTTTRWTACSPPSDGSIGQC